MRGDHTAAVTVPVDVVRSAAWAAGPAPRVTVVVSTVDRAPWLTGLVEALQQQVGAPAFELVVVDDGSRDRTWDVLQDAVARTPLAMAAVRLAENRGAGTGRNRGVAQGRAPLVAFTDDDCLPAPGWLCGLARAFDHDADVDVVQGRTQPQDTAPPGPWARSLWVTGPTPWLETCNIAYRRAAFDAVGGFDEDDPFFSRSGRGRGFAEDTWLGSRVLARGGRRAFAPDAVVHHRWRDGSLRSHLAERRLMRDFPELTRRVPQVRQACWGRVFLSRRTAEVDLAVAAVAAAALTRRPVLLAAALPWLRGSWGPARARRGPVALRLGQQALLDLAGLAALAEGSVRHRRTVL
jgi:glycosyltransferase involved in cell wall biosynthesis